MTGYQSKKAAAQDKMAQQAQEPVEDATMQSLKDLWRSVSDEVGKAAFAQPTQPALVKFKCTVVDDQHPQGIPLEKWGNTNGGGPAQPAQEPVACLPPTPISENALYTDPPQRTWVGIPEEDLKQGDESFFVAWREGARWADAYLKEKNT
jgi:hypothetical protein